MRDEPIYYPVPVVQDSFDALLKEAQEKLRRRKFWHLLKTPQLLDQILHFRFPIIESPFEFLIYFCIYSIVIYSLFS